MHGWRVYAPFVRGSGAGAAKSGQQGNAASSRSIPAMRGNHGDADDAGDSHVYQRIQAIDRAIALLKAIADSAAPLTALELGRTCGINRSTAWRVLHTLEHHGLVDRDAATQRYTVGYGAIAIAGAVDSDALVRRARPMLEDLAARTGEATDLTVMKRFSLVPLDQVDAPKAMTPSWLGKTLPLHATSSGKVFLAWMTAEERAAVLPEQLQRFTDRTVTNHQQLERDLAAIRRFGYAVCMREFEEFTSGVSAPILSARRWPLAVVGIWGPALRIQPTRLREFGLEAVKTAQLIADSLA